LYPGAHGIRDTLAAGAATAGASVHFVSAGVDDGPLIASETTAILPDEDEDSLGERIRVEIEHHLYPAVIDALAEGRVEADGERFRIN
jgi:phosphoribosylglycinamide formyltransferase-1